MSIEKVTVLLKEVAHFEISGKYDNAMELIRPWLKESKPRPRIIVAYARLSVHYEEQEKAIALIEDIFNNFTMDAPLKSSLHYHAGSLYDGMGDYDQAFTQFRLANQGLPSQFQAQAYHSFIQLQQQYFTKQRMATLAHADESAVQETPVFIVGMPRSGTTLCEQIVDRHSLIHGAGELSTVNEIVASLTEKFALQQPYPQCLDATSSLQMNKLAQQYISTALKGISTVSCVTDKMPSNCGHLGLIELMLPSAKVIHCRRHPLDTCLSAYFQNFGNAHQYSRRLDYLAQMYRIYKEMVEMWHGVSNLPVYELRYEELVAHQEEKSKQLVNFCGVAWQEQCLDFNENKRDVKTCSYNQVRKPMYASSVHRWKNYQKHIEPLINSLDDIVMQYDG